MGGRRWVCLAQKNEQTRIDKGPGSTFLLWIELLISSSRLYLSALGVLLAASIGRYSKILTAPTLLQLDKRSSCTTSLFIPFSVA